MQPRIGFMANIVLRRKQYLKKSRQVFFAELFGLLREARAFVVAGRNQLRIRSADAGDEQITDVPNCFAAEMLEVLPLGK